MRGMKQRRCMHHQLFSAMVVSKPTPAPSHTFPSPEHPDSLEVEKILKRFDTNGDGRISSVDLSDALRTFGSTFVDDVQRTIVEININGDGYIDFKEYCTFARANHGLMNDVTKYSKK